MAKKFIFVSLCISYLDKVDTLLIELGDESDLKEESGVSKATDKVIRKLTEYLTNIVGEILQSDDKTIGVDTTFHIHDMEIKTKNKKYGLYLEERILSEPYLTDLQAEVIAEIVGANLKYDLIRAINWS